LEDRRRIHDRVLDFGRNDRGDVIHRHKPALYAASNTLPPPSPRRRDHFWPGAKNLGNTFAATWRSSFKILRGLRQLLFYALAARFFPRRESNFFLEIPFEIWLWNIFWVEILR
jgi:hypothetical protein